MEGTATGCFKCGRAGHWSRDCPFSPSNTNTNTNTNTLPSSSSPKKDKVTDAALSVGKPKPKKMPRSRPKLTPDLLLSPDGLPYVLRYFPPAFNYTARGNEVPDLGNLLHLYSEWHSRLIPYYSFNQFVHKVEQVAASKRVKTCIRELRERVANGGDPTKLREPPVEHHFPADNHEAGEASHQQEDVFPESHQAENNDTENNEEDILNEVFDKATAEPSQFTESIAETSNAVSNSGTNTSGKAEITEEQRARMEANRLKALERRAARVHSSEAT